METNENRLRRRYMLAAVRLAQAGEPARLDDNDLFDLFAMIGEPEFCVWRECVAVYEQWREELNASAEAQTPVLPLTHREFDAQLRRERPGRRLAGSPRDTVSKEATHGA